MSESTSAPKPVAAETAKQAAVLDIDPVILAHTVQTINRANRIARTRRTAATAVALAASGFLANQVVPVHPQALLTSATAAKNLYNINHQLNTGDKVATEVTVEQGYDLPLDPGVIPYIDHIDNPINLGGGTFAYRSPDAPTGTIIFKKVHATHPLQVQLEGGKSDEYPHEVKTSVANVYDQYPKDDGTMDKYFFAVMGGKAGEVMDLTNVPPNATKAQADEIVSQQLGQLAAAGVGNLVGQGK